MIPNTCITGMCIVSPHSFYERPKSEAEIRTAKNNEEVVAYFEQLGFSVHRDSDRRKGIYWHEISDEDGLICQIDGGVSLKSLREDMIAWYNGAKANVGCEDYDIAGSIDRDGLMTPEFQRLCRFVAEKPPETQLTLLT